MIWTRTASGLRNFGIFTRKKYTAYCEGGEKSFAPQDVLAGNWAESTEDAAFWRAIFRFTKTEVHVKSIGNCHAVDEMAELIIQNNIPFSIACRDRDWLLEGERKSDRRVLYTYGYAWESDLLSPSLVSFAYSDLSLCPPENAKIIAKNYEKAIEEFSKVCKWPLKLQYQSRKNDYAAVPTNRNLGGVIEVVNENGVMINRKKWRELLRRNKARFSKCDDGKSFSEISIRDVPGHARMGFAVEFIKNELRRDGKNVSNREIVTVLLSNFAKQTDSCLETVVSRHYKSITARL